MSHKRSISSLFNKSQKLEEAPKISSSIGADKPVEALYIQPDGKILVGGKFTTLRGQKRVGIGRLNPDGTLDTEFNPDINGWVSLISLQRDEKILIGGTSFPAKYKRGYGTISRLNQNGTGDTQFNSVLSISDISSIALRADDSILIAGRAGGVFGPDGLLGLGEAFGSGYTHLVCLNADGSLEDSYRLREKGAWGIIPDDALTPVARMVGINTIQTVAVQADGKILLGGCFAGLGMQSRKNFGRLNADGSVDIDFQANANDFVKAICLQDDGKILVAGNFTKLQGQKCKRIARLNPDGKLDRSFYAEAPESISQISVQNDGKIVVRILGDWLMRFNSNGIKDESFKKPKIQGWAVFSMQQDGRIVIGGSFTKVNGQRCERIARLNPDGTLDSSFA